MTDRERNSNFQNWLIDHDPDDNLLWKKSFWSVYVFIRDTIIPMFEIKADELHDIWGDEYFKRKKASIDSFVEVIGEHWSKSILNPVIKLTYKGVTFVFRYNFYDYEVAVIGDVPITLPDRLIYSQDRSFFYQGFPDEYKLKNRYHDGTTTFIAGMNRDYQFYTFMFLMRDIIDKYRKETK